MGDVDRFVLGGDKGVRRHFASDSGIRSMSRMQRRCSRKGVKLFPYRFFQCGEIAAGQIGPPNAAGEDGIAHEATVLGRNVERNVPRAMTGHMQYVYLSTE